MVSLSTETVEEPAILVQTGTREPSPAPAELDVSIIVLLEPRRRTAWEIYREYAPPLRELHIAFEFLFVRSPDCADLGEAPPDAQEARGTVRLLEVGQPVGQSAVLRLALEHCRGGTILTLPPALRVAPEALPELIRQVEAGSDVAVARRSPRLDSWVNRLQSGFVSWCLNVLTGARLHDVTCRVHAIRRAVLAEVPLYGSYFRFLPIVAEREGFRVDEVPVRQHPGDGRSHMYSPAVYLGWLIDILGIFFLLRFTYRPLRFFGWLGAVFALLGSGILAVLFLQRLGGQGIANRPTLVLGVLLLTLGVQSVALGLLGEIVVHFQAARGSTYRVVRDSRTAP